MFPAFCSVTDAAGTPVLVPPARPAVFEFAETAAENVAGAPGSPFAPAAPAGPAAPAAPRSPFAPLSAFTVAVESLDVVTAWVLICAVPTLFLGSLTAA